MSDLISIKLTPRERSLLLHYGYPFKPEKDKLEELEGCKRPRKLEVSMFYVEQLVGNLSISVNEMAEKGPERDDALLRELDDLATYLETELSLAEQRKRRR